MDDNGPPLVLRTCPVAVATTDNKQSANEQLVNERGHGNTWCLRQCPYTAGLIHGDKIEKNDHQNTLLIAAGQGTRLGRTEKSKKHIENVDDN